MNLSSNSWGTLAPPRNYKRPNNNMPLTDADVTFARSRVHSHLDDGSRFVQHRDRALDNPDSETSSDSDSDTTSYVLTPDGRSSMSLRPVATPFRPSVQGANPPRVAEHMDVFTAFAPPATVQSRHNASIRASPPPPNPLFQCRAPTQTSAPLDARGLSGMHTSTEDRVQKLENLFYSHSRQLAAHQETIRNVNAENAELRSMLAGREQIRPDVFCDGLNQANEMGAHLSERADELEKSLRAPAQDLTVDIAFALENVRKMQDVQSMSISAVAGQVASLDKLLHSTTDNLGKEMQHLSLRLSVAARKINDLVASQNESLTTVQTLQGDKDAHAKQLDDLKFRTTSSDNFTDVQIKTLQAKVDDQHKANDELRKTTNQDQRVLRDIVDKKGAEIMGINFRLDNVRLRDDSPIFTLEQFVKEQFEFLLSQHTRSEEMKSNVQELQTDVSGMQKRATHRADGHASAPMQMRDEAADLTRRADEVVVVTDAGRAALHTDLTQLQDEVAAIRMQMSGVNPHALREDAAQASKQFEESQESVRCMQEKMYTLTKRMIELDTEARTIGREELNEVRDSLVTSMMGLGLKVERLEACTDVTKRDAVSEVALKHIDRELAELRNAIESLKKTCAFPGTNFDTVEGFVASLITSKLKEVRKTQDQGMPNIVSALDDLRQQFFNTTAAQDNKIAAATVQTREQNTFKRSITSTVDELHQKVDQAHGTHDAELSRLANRIDGLAKKHTPALETAAKEREDIRDHMYALEGRVADAASMDDVFARIQAAQGVWQDAIHKVASDTEKEIKKVEADNSRFTKHARERCDTQAKSITDRVDRLDQSSTNMGKDLNYIYDRIHVAEQDIKNLCGRRSADPTYGNVRDYRSY